MPLEDASVLGVDFLNDSNNRVYLIPSFTKPPRSVEEWFNDRSNGSLAALVTCLEEVAVGRRDQNGAFILEQRGTVS